MRAEERIGLARQAYQRALVTAREESTRASWGRLLTASRNLKAAQQDREKRTARPPGRTPPGGNGGGLGRPPQRHDPAAPPSPASSTARPERRDRENARAAGSPAPRGLGLARWRELSKDWEHSRVLRKHARDLVAQTRDLCTEIAALARKWPHPVPIDG